MSPGSPDWSSEKRVCVTVTSDQAGNCVTMNGAVNNGRCSGNGVTGSLYSTHSSYQAIQPSDTEILVPIAVLQCGVASPHHRAQCQTGI